MPERRPPTRGIHESNLMKGYQIKMLPNTFMPQASHLMKTVEDWFSSSM